MDVRTAGVGDVDAVVETITLAFRHDPVWGPALLAADGGDEHLRPYWGLFVDGAQRHNTVFITGAADTVSVWIPPGETDLSAENEADLSALVNDRLEPARARALFELWERFDQHRQSEPHAYLSLLATRPDLAGRGYGQAHLAADLARWDTAGIPTYLESTNPRNDRRYERQGYVKVSQFEAVLDRAVVTTMWRPVGG